MNFDQLQARLAQLGITEVDPDDWGQRFELIDGAPAGESAPAGWIQKTAHVDPSVRVPSGVIILGNAQVGPGVILEDEAMVGGNAQVTGGKIRGRAYVGGDVQMRGGQVKDEVQIFGSAEINQGSIRGNVKVYGNSEINGGWMWDRAQIFGNAKVRGCFMYEDARVYEDAEVSGGYIHGHADVAGHAKVSSSQPGLISRLNNVLIAGGARVDGHSEIEHEAQIGGNAVITDEKVGGRESRWGTDASVQNTRTGIAPGELTLNAWEIDLAVNRGEVRSGAMRATLVAVMPTRGTVPVSSTADVQLMRVEGK